MLKQIEFKTLVLIYKCFTDNASPYLSELITHISLTTVDFVQEQTPDC